MTGGWFKSYYICPLLNQTNFVFINSRNPDCRYTRGSHSESCLCCQERSSSPLPYCWNRNGRRRHIRLSMPPRSYDTLLSGHWRKQLPMHHGALPRSAPCRDKGLLLSCPALRTHIRWQSPADRSHLLGTRMGRTRRLGSWRRIPPTRYHRFCCG